MATAYAETEQAAAENINRFRELLG